MDFEPLSEVPDYSYYDPESGRTLTELPDDYDQTDEVREAEDN